MTATLEAPADAAADDEAVEPPRPARPVPAALAPWHDPHPRMAWLVTLIITVLAGFTRFWALGFPPGQNAIPKNGMNFDEVYYAVEAQEMLRYGYEDNRGYLFIVHPPLGKWLIGWGSALFGDGPNDAFGWRVAPA